VVDKQIPEQQSPFTVHDAPVGLQVGANVVVVLVVAEDVVVVVGAAVVVLVGG